MNINIKILFNKCFLSPCESDKEKKINYLFPPCHFDKKKMIEAKKRFSLLAGSYK